MAFNAAVTIEVRNGGNDTNGGGFRTGASGTDWTLQTAAQYSVTDGVTAGTTTITSATANFGTDVVGNLIYVQGGTGSITDGWYEITARTNATTITVDRSTGLTSGTGVTLKIGGALASPGAAGQVLSSGGNVAGNSVYIKYNASPYVITTASTNTSGGCISASDGITFTGYDTTRSRYNLDANRPTLRLNAGVTSATIFGNLNANYYVQSLILDGNSQTGSSGTQTSGEFFYVKAMNCVTGGLRQNSTGVAIYCEATGCSGAPITVAQCYWCVAYSNTLSSPTNNGAFNPGQDSVLSNCISYNNTGDGFTCNASTYINCVAYGNSQYGFNMVNGTGTAVNCVSESNTLGGYRINAGVISMYNCANFNNTRFTNSSSGRQLADVSPINGSGSFFTNAAGGVFIPNNTAGAGALLRGLGFPTAFLNSAGADYADAGAIQHQDAGGGTTVIGVIGG